MIKFLPLAIFTAICVAVPLASLQDVREAKLDKCTAQFNAIETDTDTEVFETTCGHVYPFNLRGDK